mmetsp:Transcript_15860/g.23210  ORF Transcript_15860/g.23210 Transcript_15860/m.23210 type:complete len:132 (-) Transcript_15860:183-578(-)
MHWCVNGRRWPFLSIRLGGEEEEPADPHHGKNEGVGFLVIFLCPLRLAAARMVFAWYYGDVSTYRVARLGVEDFELEEKKQGRTVHNESGQTNFSRPGPETGGRNRSCEHHDDDALIIALQIVQRARRRNF